jgi:hypothetical protein
MVEGKIIQSCKSATEEFLRKHYTDEESFQKRIKFTYSIVLKCGKCESEPWMQVTTTQIHGDDCVICVVCKEENILL